MPQDDRDVLEALKFELQFLEKGGYGRSPRDPWRAQLIFEDSPTCMNYDSKAGPRARPTGSEPSAANQFQQPDPGQQSAGFCAACRWGRSPFRSSGPRTSCCVSLVQTDCLLGTANVSSFRNPFR